MQELTNVIGPRTLDSPDLRTGLCIVLKRMDTGSDWIVMNNPRSVFWETPADGSFAGNRHLPLAQVVRASTAAPELLRTGTHRDRVRASTGAVHRRRPHAAQQPCLLMLMTALVPAYELNWRIGPENLLIVSVGTGSFHPTLSPADAMRSSAIGLAIKSLAAMIAESQLLVLTLMTYLGQSPIAWPINSEIGDLGRVLAPTGNLFRFLRYDIRLEQSWLTEKLGKHFSADFIAKLRPMDNPANMQTLYELGQSAVTDQVKRDDLMFAKV